MQQFIPFEDDWESLAHLPPERLVPYRKELLQGSRQPESPAAYLPTTDRAGDVSCRINDLRSICKIVEKK
jgi:hypothetical protein